MIAQKQTPHGATSSDRNISQESRNGSVERHVSRDNEGLDIARLSPQQIAAELARRSQTARPAGAAEEDGPEVRAPKVADAASPFEKLSQAWAPTAEERLRLKEQYVAERYRWEEEQDRRLARKLRDGVEDGSGLADKMDDEVGDDVLRRDGAAKEWVSRVERNIDAINARLRGDEQESAPDVLAPSKHRAPSTSRTPMSATPAVGREEIRGDRFGDAAPREFAGEFHARGYPEERLVPQSPADEGHAGENLRRDDPSLGHAAAAVRQESAGWAARPSMSEMIDREPRLGTRSQIAAAPAVEPEEAASSEAGRPQLRAPEDVRNLVTTSFERPVASSQRHHHGVLLIFTALILGLVLYFHPWSTRQEGPVHSDLPSDAANTAGNSPASTPAKQAENKPADKMAPAPAASMTPLSAQSAGSPPPANVPSANAPASTAATGQASGESPAANAPAAQPPATTNAAQPAPSTQVQANGPQGSGAQGNAAPAETAAALPQATGPKQSFAPATTPTPRDDLKSAVPALRSSGPSMTAQPTGDRAQNQTKAALQVKPSPAWLHAQPYGGANSGEAAPVSGPTTPDAWLKPQPYREPGVLTPPD